MELTPAKISILIVALEFIIEHRLGKPATLEQVIELRDELLYARNNGYPLTFALPSLPTKKTEQAHARHTASGNPSGETASSPSAKPSNTRPHTSWDGDSRRSFGKEITRLSRLAADLQRGIIAAVRERGRD